MEATCYNQEVSDKNDYHKNGSSRSFCGRSMNAQTSGGRFRFCDSKVEDHEQTHFLDSCFLCKKPLGNNRDIFMYRGDMPFCSEECREEQMEEDEEKTKKWNISSSVKTLRSKEQPSLPTKSGDCTVLTGPVAV